MNGKLFHSSDISEIYGLSQYEARTIMNKIPKINISNGSIRPRWVVKQEDLEAYFARRTEKNNIDGLDRFGKLLRRR